MAGFGIPVAAGAQIKAGGNSTAQHEPGTIIGYKVGDQWSFVQYLQLNNDGCASYEALVKNFATLKQYSVKASAVTDEGAPFVGVAIKSISSQYFGWVVIKGYCENALVSSTTASGEYLIVSGSTAAQLTNNKASCFTIGTAGAGLAATGFQVVAVANAIYGSAAYGSIQLLGMWGV